MQKILVFTLLLLNCGLCSGRTVNDPGFSIVVLNEKQLPVEGATIQLLAAKDSAFIKAGVTDANGTTMFKQMADTDYIVRISCTGYETRSLGFSLPMASDVFTIQLQAATQSLHGVSVTARRPLIQRAQGKLIVNVDAAVTNVGTTVLEVLEKSPGVTVDKNGSISMQGKTGVLIMIDDKPTYLSGTDLANMLGSMNSAQVDQIELITNPSAKYDANGNAGIINIKTKKNRQQGFNATLNIAAGQGRYTKNNNSIVANYRKGRFNCFLNYAMNYNKGFVDLYALRSYYTNGITSSLLEQPSFFSSNNWNHTVKTGVDYYASKNTTVGISLTGIALTRKGSGNADAIWKKTNGAIDSSIATNSGSSYRFNNAAANLHVQHTINKAQALSADVDWLAYDIANSQYFNNTLLAAGGYTEASIGNLPAQIHIFSAKADHSLQLGKNGKLESGIKTSHTNTDNIAAYQYFDGVQWKDDLGKSNHFLYHENIHALYASIEQKYQRFTLQAGLRYEYTAYHASQLGNSVNKDSSFSRNYDGLFPSGYISYQMDSANAFTFTGSRRIDRPAFQKLNPFVFIINKYTYQTGNPFFLPQDTWNMELGHQYKQLLTTTLSYSIIKNYFSQLFLTDSNGILLYSEGNVGRMHNWGLSVSVQAAPYKWWSLTGTTVVNHKKFEGFVWGSYHSSVTEMNVSMSNQFKLGKQITAELSGFYTTRSRNDLQELLSPTGQMSVGFSMPVLQQKGTLKCSVRDIFYSQKMEGVTDFQSASEYFVLRRDSRVVNLAFSYRFGKQYKTIKHSTGGASDEMQRAGNGA